jgi:hypothetical protein
MAAIQLNFTLRTSANCKTVHLIGSWDGYKAYFPLNKDPSKSGGWKGTFRFQGNTLKQGQRYWYYYIIDGHHVSHDPARESVTEPTSGRKLNILDIPMSKPPDSSQNKANRSSHRRSSSAQVPKGRSLSPSQIQSPLPTKPNATRQITKEQFKNPTVEQLSAKLAATEISDSEESSSEEEEEDSSEDDSESGSDVPSLTSRSSNNSSPSSLSSTSSCCTCERYGITRGGDRVKLDCGGARCGYTSGSSSECSSESEDDHKKATTRRQGIVVRK